MKYCIEPNCSIANPREIREAHRMLEEFDRDKLANSNEED